MFLLVAGAAFAADAPPVCHVATFERKMGVSPDEARSFSERVAELAGRRGDMTVANPRLSDKLLQAQGVSDVAGDKDAAMRIGEALNVPFVAFGVVEKKDGGYIVSGGTLKVDGGKVEPLGPHGGTTLDAIASSVAGGMTVPAEGKSQWKIYALIGGGVAAVAGIAAAAGGGGGGGGGDDDSSSAGGSTAVASGGGSSGGSSSSGSSSAGSSGVAGTYRGTTSFPGKTHSLTIVISSGGQVSIRDGAGGAGTGMLSGGRFNVRASWTDSTGGKWRVYSGTVSGGRAFGSVAAGSDTETYPSGSFSASK